MRYVFKEQKVKVSNQSIKAKEFGWAFRGLISLYISFLIKIINDK